MNIKQALQNLVDGQSLTRDEMRSVMTEVMTGAATPTQIGALLVALRIRGETIEEIVGAAEVMRSLVTRVHADQECLIDLVGTGGDGANLFNVSTAATFVVAAAGARVAKHGNRSVSSSSGSSDVLQSLGVALDLSPEGIALSIEQVGMGFMFAPAHHGAMKHAVGPRKDLGMRTLFNILGPLTNPAFVERQVLGVLLPICASHWPRLSANWVASTPWFCTVPMAWTKFPLPHPLQCGRCAMAWSNASR